MLHAAHTMGSTGPAQPKRRRTASKKKLVRVQDGAHAGFNFHSQVWSTSGLLTLQDFAGGRRADHHQCALK